MRPIGVGRGARTVLALLVLAGPGFAQAPAEGPRSPVNAELAQALSRKIRAVELELKAGRVPSKTVQVSEGELNSYLAYEVKLPPSLSGLDVRLERDRVAARGLLDLDQLQDRAPNVPGLGGLALLSGKVPVTIRGRLASEDGFGSVELEEVRLGSIPIAPAVLGQVVAAATKTAERPHGFDILAPFRYPYSVRRVRLQAGRAYFDF
jgi:hypothetical protein